MKCCICQEILDTGHPYRVHKIKLADYMKQFYPRQDLLTLEDIEFKGNIENYLLKDFNSRLSLKRWLKTQTKESIQEYLKEILIRRREIKQIKYIPTQVECRSYESFPGIVTFNEYWENYYDLCQKLGYQSRGFINLNRNSILKKERDIKNIPILCDSREQSYLKLGNDTIEIATLPYADYCLKNNNYGIYFERKELSDFISSHSQGFARLKNEIKRAQLNNDYIIMMVESSLSDAMSFEYLPHISKKIQATSSFIMHRCREIIQEFPNYQVCFTKGRGDLVNKMKFIMEYGQNARKIDWELASNLKLLQEGV